MKKLITMLLMVTGTSIAYSQENMVTLSGGYAFANIEEASADGTGWRINGLYEFNPSGSKFAHGFSVGYVSLSGEGGVAQEETKYDIGSWPIYYAPKFLMGNESLKGFLKGAIGWQFSNVSRTGAAAEGDSNDSGFAMGAGAGASYFVNEKVFVTAEYEFLWLQNSFFRDGYLNTASLGIGFRF